MGVRHGAAASTGPVVTRRRHQAATTEKAARVVVKRWLGQLSGVVVVRQRGRKGGPSLHPEPSGSPGLRRVDGGGGTGQELCPAGRHSPRRCCLLAGPRPRGRSEGLPVPTLGPIPPAPGLWPIPLNRPS